MSPFTYPLAFPLSSSIAPTHHYPFIGARTPDHHGDSCGGAGVVVVVVVVLVVGWDAMLGALIAALTSPCTKINNLRCALHSVSPHALALQQRRLLSDQYYPINSPLPCLSLPYLNSPSLPYTPVQSTLPHPIPSLLQPTSLIAPPSFQQNTSFSHLFPPLSLPPPPLPPSLFTSPPSFPPSFLPFHPILFSLSPLLLLHLYLLLLLLLLLLTHTHSYTHTHLVATFLPACLLHSLP
ncbi:serine [Echinococcus multilocularis]|uniref:Serine n=1 Tax=Echinococcus multilocularis TaxID=6211 RepID=A0A0S4MKA3_ECHMU|nr:serine [Echinococcus multilocularis]